MELDPILSKVPTPTSHLGQRSRGLETQALMTTPQYQPGSTQSLAPSNPSLLPPSVHQACAHCRGGGVGKNSNWHLSRTVGDLASSRHVSSILASLGLLLWGIPILGQGPAWAHPPPPHAPATHLLANGLPGKIRCHYNMRG